MEALKALFDLSNSEWLIIAPLLPGAEGKKNGRFNRWAKKGIWLCMFETLAANSPQSLQLIDSSIIRAHQQAAGGKRAPDSAIGRSRGGLSTKINAAVDQAGMPIRVVLSPGQASDRPLHRS